MLAMRDDCPDFDPPSSSKPQFICIEGVWWLIYIQIHLHRMRKIASWA